MFAPAKEKFVGLDHETAGLQFHQPGEDGVEIALGGGMENCSLVPPSSIIWASSWRLNAN